jgi:adenine-specific DNA methylase
MLKTAKPKIKPRSRFADLDENKLRGGYYTTKKVAEWLCGWAIQSASDVILEPSCGDGAFLEAAVLRLQELRAHPAKIANTLTGVEILKSEAQATVKRLKPLLGVAAEKIVHNSDFFAWLEDSGNLAFDAIIGNPPFIRYQSFPEPHRTRAMELMEKHKLKPNKLTNIWVPFVVGAIAKLKPGGRLALVLPAEILQVTYAAQLRSFLTDHFARIDVIACNELFFEKAEQEVVLLLAEGAIASGTESNVCRVALTESETAAKITDSNPVKLLEIAEAKEICHESEKWLKYFLSNQQISFMRALKEGNSTTPFSTHGSIDVGVVTGKNEFFVLSNDQIKNYGLEGYTTPLVSKSAHLKGSIISKTDWKNLSDDGARVHLMDISREQSLKLPLSLKRYIKEGERQKFHLGYKCSIRKPWYLVPSVWVPDGFAFRQIYDFPRIVLNSSGATSTDTIHRFKSNEAKPEKVIANSYTCLTAASAEIEGRSYGGGVLELEPTEAERMMMPAKLGEAMPLKEADKLVRAGKIDYVLEENARVILREQMGLTTAECGMLKSVWIKMRDRRNARQRGSKKLTPAVV